MEKDPERVQASLRLLAQILAAGCVLLGLVFLAGWIFDIKQILHAVPGVTMKVNTALGFVLGGIATLLVSRQQSTWRLGSFLGLSLLAIGAATGLQDLWGVDFGIDQLLAKEEAEPAETIAPGRMSPNTAIAFGLIGAALAILPFSGLFSGLGQFLGAVVFALGITTTVTRLMGIENLYQFPRYTTTAWHTALGFVALGIAVCFARADRGFMAMITGRSGGGLVARRLLPVALLPPLLLAPALISLGNVLAPLGILSFLLMAVLTGVLLAGAVWLTAHAVENKERTLELQRKFLETTLANIGDGVIATDLDLRVSIMNPEAERLTGWTQAEAKGLEVAKIFEVRRQDTEFLSENPLSQAVRDRRLVELADKLDLVSKEGARRPVDISATPIESTDGELTGAVLAFGDASDRRARMQELQRSEEEAKKNSNRLQLAASAAKFGMYDVDLKTADVFWSKESKEILGFEPESTLPTTIEMQKLIHPADRDRVIEAVWNATEPDSTGEFYCEHRILRKSGETRWISLRGSVLFEGVGKERKAVRGTGVMLDITAQKQHEVLLRRQFETFTRLVDQSPFGIYVVDSEFRVARVSQGAQPAFRNVRPLIGRDFAEAMHIIWPEPLAVDIIGKFRHTLETGEPYLAPSLTEQRVDSDETESYEWQLHRVTLPDGTYGVVCYYYDVTQLVEVEQALRKSEREAQRANRSKSEFLANMSHEIRTPMAAIIGHADVLLAQADDPERRSSASIIKRNGEHLIEIINDILDLSRIESGKLEAQSATVNLPQLLLDLESLMRVRAENSSIRFSVAAVGKIPQFIDTDDKRLRQVLMNLVGNAIKFTKVGKVLVRAELLPVEGDEDIEDNRGQRPQRFVRFAVEDTGIGIAEEHLETLFEPFVQADSTITRTFGGTGLGLAICRRMTELLGGELVVESVLGEGSTFSLTVPVGLLEQTPLVDLSPSLEKEKERAADSVESLNARILVVDDNPDLRTAARHFLERAGAIVVTGRDGTEAIQLLQEARRADEQFDALVIDMQMPELDGYSAVSELRGLGHDLFTVALTAAAMPGDRERCLSAGCNDYLTKPVDYNALISLLNQALQPAPVTSPTATKSYELERTNGTRPLRTATEERSVLVVDDHVDSAEATEILLEASGLEVRVAHDGARAREVVEQYTPSTIVLDIGLPDVDGRTLAREFRANGYGGHLIALTGRSAADEVQKSLDAGFDEHLVKPIEPDVLIARIKHGAPKLS